MSHPSQHKPEDSLQHAAEHEKPSKRNPVLFYLMILFAVAFLLLLMSFMMQSRANQEAMSHLEETSNSAVESLENKLKENEQLKAQVTQLEEENQQLTSQLEEQSGQVAESQEELKQVVQALTALNTLRSLYNQGRYSDARDFLAEQELNADNSYVIEDYLTLYNETYATPEELEIYDPLAAWQQLVSWLG